MSQIPKENKQQYASQQMEQLIVDIFRKTRRTKSRCKHQEQSKPQEQSPVPHTAGSFPEAEDGKNNKTQHQEQSGKVGCSVSKHQTHYGT
jgi:hypothetical protein